MVHVVLDEIAFLCYCTIVEQYRSGTVETLMSDDRTQPPLPAKPRYQELQFDGDDLLAIVIEGDGVATPVRVVCQALGLDTAYQLARLREHDVLYAGLREVRVPQDGQLRVVAALLHKYIPYWLATITPNQVRDDLRPKLVRYQTELVELLAALYGPELPETPAVRADPALTAMYARMTELLTEFRLARQAIVDYRQETDSQLEVQDERIGALESIVEDLQHQLSRQVTITAAQQEFLKRSIQRLASRYAQKTGKQLYGLLFAEFCKTLKTPRYDALPAHKYEAALAWLTQKAQALLPDDPDALPPLQQRLL